ncbi:UNVERIFIED_CONTAM: UBP1-associated protein 2C [Sesamum radiatum]|uniref:UBP1-associated protein 2C n=1 Tax=Sesamum radiatum TaxID=300843 RepID=A0AAW2T2A3_SESRA
MDLAKKRKADENGRAFPLTSDINNTAAAAAPLPIGILSPEDAEKILEPFTKEQLLPILRAAVLRHPDVLEAVRTVADADPVQRKLFVRGLGWENHHRETPPSVRCVWGAR